MSRATHREIELENQLVIAKIFARRLFEALAARVDHALDTLMADASYDTARIVDVAYDAAEIVWEKHRITVVPCRRILDGQRADLNFAWPAQGEAYLGHWPDGISRNLTRAQLLMMAGMDSDESGDVAQPAGGDIPF